jgi:hypothetical protein
LGHVTTGGKGIARLTKAIPDTIAIIILPITSLFHPLDPALADDLPGYTLSYTFFTPAHLAATRQGRNIIIRHRIAVVIFTIADFGLALDLTIREILIHLTIAIII